jgi:hypothetical protein
MIEGAPRFAGAVVAALVLLFAAPAGAATPKPGSMRATVVKSFAPKAKLVRETYVRVYDPLPDAAGPHPAACDWIGYLRFRSADGPRDPSRADAIGVFMPGYLGGSGYYEPLARNTVRNAAAKHRSVEIWALDRRSNCLEDHRGLRAAVAAEDATVAFGYYFGGQAIDGHTFAGFKSGDDVEFLRSVGLDQTLRDWRTVLTTGIPDPRVRRRKVVCGGHSLGGPITAAFAGWDFDGDPSTTADAGYRQCAAFVGFDTRFTFNRSSTAGASPQALLNLLGTVTDSPNENTTPLTPETFQLPAIFAIGAFFDPDKTDVLPQLPQTVNIETALRLLFSRNAATFATGPTLRAYTLSNAAVLAGIFDDNSAPLSFLRVSVGFLVGGPVADKNFPTQGDGTFVIPSDETSSYAWEVYDQVGAPGHPLTTNEAGGTYTARESETVDLRDLARSLFEARANFIEQYFPRRLTADVAALGNGDRSGTLANLRYNGVAKRPAMLIQAGDSARNTNPDDGPPIVGDPPNDKPLSGRITIPGYNHNDVLLAARRQNDGRPEPSSTALTAYLLAITAG